MSYCGALSILYSTRLPQSGRCISGAASTIASLKIMASQIAKRLRAGMALMSHCERPYPISLASTPKSGPISLCGIKLRRRRRRGLWMHCVLLPTHPSRSPSSSYRAAVVLRRVVGCSCARHALSNACHTRPLPFNLSCPSPTAKLPLLVERGYNTPSAIPFTLPMFSNPRFCLRILRTPRKGLATCCK